MLELYVLDYFPDKPWFLTKEVVMIDVGKGDNIYLNVPHMTLPPRPNFQIDGRCDNPAINVP